MRGAFVDQGKLFSYISPEARVPGNHPLRKIRALVREVLSDLNAPPNDRMHLWLGQARHDAQDQTSRHRQRRRRLPAQPDRLHLIRIPKLVAA